MFFLQGTNIQMTKIKMINPEILVLTSLLLVYLLCYLLPPASVPNPSLRFQLGSNSTFTIWQQYIILVSRCS
jgi:hypothetical protein